MNGSELDQLTFETGNFVAGRHVHGRGAAIDVRRPSDGRVYREMRASSLEDVDEAVENAWAAFRTSGWAQSVPRDRMRIMRRWADLVEAEAATLAPLEALGSTRPIAQATAWDIPTTAECIRFFSEWPTRSAARSRGRRPTSLASPSPNPMAWWVR